MEMYPIEYHYRNQHHSSELNLRENIEEILCTKRPMQLLDAGINAVQSKIYNSEQAQLQGSTNCSSIQHRHPIQLLFSPYKSVDAVTKNKLLHVHHRRRFCIPWVPIEMTTLGEIFLRLIHLFRGELFSWTNAI